MDKDTSHQSCSTKATTTTTTTTTTSSSSSPPPVPVVASGQDLVVSLQSLPDIAHHAISTYLTNKDLLRVMESSTWLVKAYEGGVKQVLLGQGIQDTTVMSLLRRHPGLQRMKLTDLDRLVAVANVMKEGHCANLQELHLTHETGMRTGKVPLSPLLEAVAGGASPKLHTLRITTKYEGMMEDGSLPDFIQGLGDALRSRMGQGSCCGLKALELISPNRTDMSGLSIGSMLSSGACEALEEFQLNTFGISDIETHLAQWIARTKAPSLRVFTINYWIFSEILTVLCPPGTAPRLEVLDLNIDDTDLRPMIEAIKRGQWAGLRSLTLLFETEDDAHDMRVELVEALHVHVPDLRCLALLVEDEEGDDMVGAVIEAIGEGAWPQLEELDMHGSLEEAADELLMELADALEGGAPCNTSLLRLNISGCGVSAEAVRHLSKCMINGALPMLECLDMSANEEIEDEGVFYLLQAMKLGALQHLKELNLEDVGMDIPVIKHILEVVGVQKACPNLEKINVRCKYVDNEAVRQLRDGLDATRGVGMVVVEALGETVVVIESFPCGWYK